MTGAAPRVAVIGGGPRGLTVCERLVALARARGTGVHIHLIDPFPPGAGRVWRTDQPAELLMNTTIGDQTVFPDASCELQPPGLGIAVGGMGIAVGSMGTWWQACTDAHCSPGRPACHSADECATEFPSRALYGRYLREAYEAVAATARATPGVELEHHAATATGIVEPTREVPGGTAAPKNLQLVRLDDGTTLECTDVVLCVGHVPAALSDERATFARFATSAGLGYVPPNLPAEADLSCAEPGRTVVFRGFGLNFFDLQARLTTGRGGEFIRADEDNPYALRYAPSGREPVLAPSSRRGTPYRCKPVTAAHGMPAHRLQFFTRESVDALVRQEPSGPSGSETAPGSPDVGAPPAGLLFNAQLWPLILADLRLAWYAALRRRSPAAVTCTPEELAQHIRAAIADPGAWPPFEAAAVPDPRDRLDLAALARPLEGLAFADRAECDAAILAFLERDLADSLAGCELAGSKSAFAVLWAARELIKEIVADGLMDPVSFETELRGWFDGFVAGICDGPPPQRFAELIALARAGLAHFVGPEVRIVTSPAGSAGAFIATSPAVPGQVRAQTLVDAASPANNVRQADDPLLAPMLRSGQLSAAEVVVAGDDAVTIPSTGLRVAGSAHHTVDARGRVHPHRYVLSIQLSAVQFGLAIAANPGKNARTLRDAHTIAAEILG